MKMLSMLCVFVIISVLAACKSLPDLPGTQILRVGDREIESIVRKHEQAAYTLVFESGSRNCIQRWEKLLQLLPRDVNVYVYNRPGYCGSSSAQTARTSENIVNELREALNNQELKPPYILIGHSMGGLYMQHFARQYPDEVHGLVLIDALYPGFMKSPDEFPLYTKVGMAIFLSADVEEEIRLASTSGLMIDALPPIDEKPIVRLFNDPKSKLDDETATEVDFGMFNRDEKLMEKIGAMYPHAKILAVDSSHQMQETSPEVVAQAILDVVLAKGPFL
ncbi:MAG: alpha/beta fold hydrolase [Cellvibrionaceae bacterium]|nr:alpha/beta fold hydrolase [Cellvibrionaceae bacterium]